MSLADGALGRPAVCQRSPVRRAALEVRLHVRKRTRLTVKCSPTLFDHRAVFLHAAPLGARSS